jgi:hypothetical protein
MGTRVGAASTQITPPVGVELAGYGFGPSTGILDDLEAQALYLESRQTSAAIVTADLLTIGPRVVARVRACIETTLGIPGERVLLSASHSHSSPTAMPLRQWGRVDEAYVHALEQRLVGAVAAAQSKAQTGCFGVALAQLAHLAENRRKGHTDIDPDVPVLRFDDENGQALAVLWSYGCHPVSLHGYRNLISPDYPGYARDAIREALGQDVVAMFALGAAGDVNPAGYVAGQTTPERAREIGMELGYEVVRVALDSSHQDQHTLRIRQTIVDLPVAPLPPVAALKQAHERWSARVEELRAAGEPWSRVSEAEIQRDWAADAIRARSLGPLHPTVPCELQAIRVGSAALLALPLEIFVETALAIKAHSPAAVTLICSNSNGGVGYLPTEDAYRRRDYTNPQGLAPKVYGVYALASGAEARLRRAAIRELVALFDPA